MGYGSYCNIADVKGVLGITSTSDDTMLRKICESASRSIDAYCNRFFYTESATKYFHGGAKIWLKPDLLSVTTLKTDEDGDATFENTYDTTDYYLLPLNEFPKTEIIISDDSDYGTFAAGIKKGVEIDGLWGYGDGISATPYISDTTLSAAISSTTATTYTVTSATNISAGQLHLIDDEQIYVYSVSSSTVTCEREVNGTTAATHDNGKTIYIYQYPSDIRQACIDLSVLKYQLRAKQGMQSEKLGDYSYNLVSPTSEGGKLKGAPKLILDEISGYKKMRF